MGHAINKSVRWYASQGAVMRFPEGGFRSGAGRVFLVTTHDLLLICSGEVVHHLEKTRPRLKVG